MNRDFRIEVIPRTVGKFDKWHRRKRTKLIDVSREELIKAKKRELRHGHAAKLINCYLKARFINCFSVECLATTVAHPPVDSLLLSTILEANLLDEGNAAIIRELRQAAWSNWDSDQYEQAIAILRTIKPDQPFWMIEEHWIGYQ